MYENLDTRRYITMPIYNLTKLLKSNTLQKYKVTNKPHLFGTWHSHRTREIGGARRDRTADLLRARQALSQLSYGP